MSDDLDIRGGGAVAVDTATLRAASAGFTGIAAELDEIAHCIGSAGGRIFSVTDLGWHVSQRVEVSRQLICAAVTEANDISAALLSAAAIYEIVELRAERAAADAAGDLDAVARIDARIGELTREHPQADVHATSGEFSHWLAWPGELARQASGALWWLTPGFHTLAVPAAWAFQRGIGALGAGTIPARSRLRGPAREVVVAPVAVSGPRTAPPSLAEAAARIPGGGDARIRVERYTMADGSRQFAVYAAGTQTVAPRTRDPFDMDSNVQLYGGERSASYDATLAALRQAGAEHGDVVHAFGHSQGGMIATRVALEGGFDARTLVTFGSPVEADIGGGTLSVALRHTDDPVTAIAAGGHAGPVGAPGSFVASRTADPQPGLNDFRLAAHGIDGYIETAQLLDASDDARMGAVRELFDDLGAAASVDVMEYSAERVEPEPQPRAGVSPSAAGGG